MKVKQGDILVCAGEMGVYNVYTRRYFTVQDGDIMVVVEKLGLIEEWHTHPTFLVIHPVCGLINVDWFSSEDAFIHGKHFPC